MYKYKLKFFVLVAALICGSLGSTLLRAGQVTTSPVTVDSFNDIVIPADGNVTFTASSGQGTVTLDQTSLGCTFQNGTPSYAGSGDTATVAVTFADAATGQNNSCTVVVNHTVPSLTGGGTQQCAQEDPFTFNVIVPEITSQTVATAPGDLDNTRTDIGAGELVTLSVSPDDATSVGDVSWAVSDGSGTVDPAMGSTTTFTASGSFEPDTIQATFAGGAIASLTLNTKTPSGETATIYATRTWPPGVQGAGIDLTITLTPSTVSFQNLEVQESDCAATSISGYFTSYSSTALKHTATAGWTAVISGNIVGLTQPSDTAYFGGYPSPWTSGSFQWIIPFRWAVVGVDTPETGIPDETQTHTIVDTTGKSTESKLGKSTTRSP